MADPEDEDVLYEEVGNLLKKNLSGGRELVCPFFDFFFGD
jgi:hypothetical protein